MRESAHPCRSPMVELIVALQPPLEDNNPHLSFGFVVPNFRQSAFVVWGCWMARLALFRWHLFVTFGDVVFAFARCFLTCLLYTSDAADE